MQKFFELRKVDEREGTIYGIMTAEEPDTVNEIFDYHGGGKDDIQRWSEETAASTGGKSLGNIRLMHGAQIAGKAIGIDYDDNARTIGLLSQPVNGEIMRMAREGYIRGYSIAGGFKKRNCAECNADMMTDTRSNYCDSCGRDVIVKFVPRTVECSYVDAPACPVATFQYVKSSGEIELRKTRGAEVMKPSDHCRETAKHHSLLALCAKARKEACELHAKVATERGDRAAAAVHKSEATIHGKEQQIHDGAAERWRELANTADKWPIAGFDSKAAKDARAQQTAAEFMAEFGRMFKAVPAPGAVVTEKDIESIFGR